MLGKFLLLFFICLFVSLGTLGSGSCTPRCSGMASIVLDIGIFGFVIFLLLFIGFFVYFKARGDRLVTPSANRTLKGVDRDGYLRSVASKFQGDNFTVLRAKEPPLEVSGMGDYEEIQRTVVKYDIDILGINERSSQNFGGYAVALEVWAASYLDSAAIEDIERLSKNTTMIGSNYSETLKMKIRGLLVIPIIVSPAFNDELKRIVETKVKISNKKLFQYPVLVELNSGRVYYDRKERMNGMLGFWWLQRRIKKYLIP